MNSDMSAYLGVFLDEAADQLSLLERECVELESSPDPKELLQNLFRAAHTVKGASRAMGFIRIGDLTHEMENVLDALRNDRLPLSPPTVDALLGATDALRVLLDEVRELGTEPDRTFEEVQKAVKDLQACLSDEPTEAPSVAARLEAETVPADAVAITIELKPETEMRGCRAILMLQSIGEWADVVGTVPSEELLTEEKFESVFQVLISRGTATPELKDQIAGIPDVASARYATADADASSSSESTPAEAALPLPSAGEDAARSDSSPACGGVPANSASSPSPAEGSSSAVEESATEAARDKPSKTAAPAQSQTIRVDVTRLDKLLNLVGELVIDRTQLMTQLARSRIEGEVGNSTGSLDEVLGRIDRVTAELQEEVMKTRMLPIDGVFQRMPRMVRDVAQKIGKEISFTMEGGETELDRSVLDMIGDPLIHILRNAVDHGVEAPDEREKAGKSRVGTVKLSACRDRNHILIEITDDGKGIDPVHLRQVAVKKGLMNQAAADALSDRDAINLIFAAGFSTAKVVSDVSGRGVGMDIVKSNLERIGGRASVESVVGAGSKITIHLPLTLAIVRAVLVSSGDSTYALPVASVTEMIDLNDSGDAFTRCTLAGQATILLRGQTFPLVNLSDALESDKKAIDPDRNQSKAHAVIVKHDSGQAALSVDALHGDQEVVIKPISQLIGEIPGVAGASILGDGKVALIIDPARTLQCLFAQKAAA